MRGARHGGGRGGSLRDECSRRDCMEQRGLCGGNASYGTGIIDAVYRMDQKMLEGRIRYEVR